MDGRFPKNKHKLITIVLVFSMLIFSVSPAYAVGFKDISGNWAENSILHLAALEIVNGYNGTFNPGSGVTRAEFAAMMVKAMGLSDQAAIVKGGSTGYKDVPAAHWASGFIILAKEMGIISGYPDSTFRPSEMIRRDEITSVLVRALKISDDNTALAELEHFADWEDIPKWAQKTVDQAYLYELVSGFPDGNFYPGRNATRGETAALIEKVLKQLDDDYTFFATVKDVNTASFQLTLDISGQLDTFYYKSDVLVTGAGTAYPIAKLKVGQKIYVNIDDDGYINYINDVSKTNISAKKNAVLTEQDVSKDQYARILSLPGEISPEDQETTPAVYQAIVITRDKATSEVAAFIKRHGGTLVSLNDKVNCIIAKGNDNLFDQLKSNPMVEEVTLDTGIKNESLSVQETGESAVSGDDNPASSLNITKQVIKAPQFVNLTHADGKNQVIAIIDTGVDPGHPDLQKTSGGLQKIVDWKDFSGEGDVDTSSLAKPQGQELPLANGRYDLGKIKSLSGVIRYGYLREVDLANPNGKTGYDMNFNGSSSDIYGVILVDSLKSGIYDTVYIDTDNDKAFSDETALKTYAEFGGYANFSANGGQDILNFVLTKINTDYSGINFGFDGNDHGTHVAGIAAANGKVKGVAPGAQIMSLKVMDASGYGKLSTITEAMIYAASHGAKIINLSLGFPTSDNNGNSVPAKLLNNLTEAYGAIFVTAAGNDGPGINTVNTPADATAALSVGAFNTPEMWKNDYGWDVPEENLWFFSSAGPRKDGAIAPSVIAPGNAVSTVPMRDGKQYFLSEGTSIAAPHVAGAIALLMEVEQRNNLKVSPVMIKRAIEMGADKLEGYSTAEQGYGALNLTISWAELMALHEESKINASTVDLELQKTGGLLFKDYNPGRVSLYLTNTSNVQKELKTNDELSWYHPLQANVVIPPGKTRVADFEIDIPEEKGLFSSFISIDDPSSYGNDVEVLTTVVNPYVLNSENNYTETFIKEKAQAAQYKRYFFKVPPGADNLKAQLTVGNQKGRAKIFLFDPDGKLVAESKNFAGVNPGEPIQTVDVSKAEPESGVWECVVYSSAGLSAYGLRQTDYSLQLSAEGKEIGQVDEQSRSVILQFLPKILKSGMSEYLTLHVRDRYTKKPFTGYIEIDEKIYFIRNGKLILPMIINKKDIDIIVRTIPESPAYKPWAFTFTFTSN